MTETHGALIVRVAELEEEVRRLREALRLALLWLPTEADMPRASDQARAQVRAIRAALAGQG